jgi:hypothetical protein
VDKIDYIKLIKTVDLFTFRITSVMTSEQLCIAEPEFLNNQQVIEIDDTVDSGDNITSYCVCERQTGSSDDLSDFNNVQCNLTESTQYCSGSSQSTEESSGTIYTSCSSSNRKKKSVSASRTTDSSNPSDSDDVLELKPLIYDDDVNNTDEVVCHDIDVFFDFYNVPDHGCLVYTSSL